MKEKKQTFATMKRLFNELAFEEKIVLMSEMYWSLYDREKDEFLKLIDCN